MDWNTAPLYDEDHKELAGTKSDTLDMSLKWSVPSYAPNGAYVATITGVDTDGSSKDFCVQASFNFS